MTAALAEEIVARGPAGDHAAFAVLLVMALGADPEGACSSSPREIARAARLDDRTTRGAIRRLRAAGWVTFEAADEERAARFRIVIAPARAAQRARPAGRRAASATDEAARDPWPAGVSDPWPAGVPDFKAEAS